MPSKVSRTPCGALHGDTAKDGARPDLVRRSPLRREIVLLLAIKGVLLYGIWYAFFSEPQLKKMTEGMDPARVAAALVAPPFDPPAAKP